MKNENNDVMFVGGFSGTSKAGRNFFALNFNVAQKQDNNHFGSSCATVFVEEDVYNDFINHAKPLTYIKANVLYVRGGYSLISYNL